MSDGEQSKSADETLDANNLEASDADLEATTRDAYDEEVDQQISRMMGEGGVAPPLKPRQWQEWSQTKDKGDDSADENSLMD